MLVVMMTKSPVPGASKTRLCPPFSSTQASKLAAALMEDCWGALAIAGVDRIISLRGSPDRLPDSLREAELWPQASGDLGARIEDVMQRGLARDSKTVAIGSDAPGLPPAVFQAANELLDSRDAVLGPTLDGGYYLIGMRRCHPGLLSDLPWSCDNTFTATASRLRQHGYRVAILPTWFDVDQVEDIVCLHKAIAASWVRAPKSYECIRELL